MHDSIYSGNFSWTGYLSLIWKDSVTHIHGLAVYVKKGLPFAGNLSKTVRNVIYDFNWLYFIQCRFSSIDYLLPFVLFLMVFLLTWTRFFQSTHLLMCLSLEALTSITGTGWPILVELIDLVNSVIIFK